VKLLLFTERFRVVGAGLENDAVALCRELLRRGHEVHVCAEQGEERDGVQVHLGLENAAELETRLAPDLTIDWAFLRPADVHRIGGGVHREFLRHAVLSIPLWRRWAKLLEYRCKAKHVQACRREARILGNPASFHVPISHLVASQLVRSGIDDSRIEILYNGVDTNRFRPSHTTDARDALRRQWQVPEQGTVLLLVANDLRLKNAAMLLRIGASLHGIDAGLRLVVVGKHAPRLQAPWLVHQPTIHEIEHAYAAADLLVHPTLYDSFGNVVLEAMSCGKPVVVSDCAGVAEIVAAEGGGAVLGVQGPLAEQRWHETIASLIRDPERRHDLGTRGRMVAENHTFTGLADQFEALLVRLAASAPRRRAVCEEDR
jgi:glycosyltransferase involved in cell wall biosynthesis